MKTIKNRPRRPVKKLSCKRHSITFLSYSGIPKINSVKKPKPIKVDDDFNPILGSEFQLKADLVLLSMGFISPTYDGMLEDLEVNLDSKNNVLANDINYQTSCKKVWTAGDMRRGQSLVVWAIREGRQCARAVDEYLMGKTLLPR